MMRRTRRPGRVGLIVTVVAASVIGLALGVGATRAAWTQSRQPFAGQTISSGDLQLTTVSTDWTWRNDSADLSGGQQSALRATAGDTLLGYWQVDADSAGDNLAGTVTVSLSNSPAVSVPSGATATWRIARVVTHTSSEVLDPAATGFSTAPAAFPSGGPLTVDIDPAGTEPIVIYLVIVYAANAVVPTAAPADSAWNFTVDFQQKRG